MDLGRGGDQTWLRDKRNKNKKCRWVEKKRAYIYEDRSLVPKSNYNWLEKIESKDEVEAASVGET